MQCSLHRCIGGTCILRDRPAFIAASSLSGKATSTFRSSVRCFCRNTSRALSRHASKVTAASCSKTARMTASGWSSRRMVSLQRASRQYHSSPTGRETFHKKTPASQAKTSEGEGVSECIWSVLVQFCGGLLVKRGRSSWKLLT